MVIYRKCTKTAYQSAIKYVMLVLYLLWEGMMIDSIEFAKFIIIRTQKLNKRDSAPIALSETKLHKLLYICDGLMLAAGINCIHEIAKAWNYGPVYPKVHNWLAKNPSAFSLPQPCKAGTIEAITEVNAQPLVDKALNNFGLWTAADLSAWSHRPGSPWERAIERGWGVMNSLIKKEDMRDYFRSILDGDN
jgi:uncharacterized phage-associated protein